MKRWVGLLGLVFLAACGPKTLSESVVELASEKGVGSDASTTSDEPPCVPRIEICNGMDDDCDGQIDNAGACGAVAGHACRLGGAFNEGECLETESCRWTQDEVFVCFPIPRGETPRWHTIEAVLQTCTDKEDGYRKKWRGEWYVCDLCDGKRRWRKEVGPRCAKGGVLEWRE